MLHRLDIRSSKVNEVFLVRPFSKFGVEVLIIACFPQICYSFLCKTQNTKALLTNSKNGETLNPRLTKVFFETRLTKVVVATPS